MGAARIDQKQQLVNAERYERVYAIFSEARRRNGADREAYLAKACKGESELRSEIEALLRIDGGFDATGTSTNLAGRILARLDSTGESAAPAIEAQPRDQVGRYRILRRIGEGGMGIVYEAEQEQPRRTVALKLIRPELASPRMLQRFELEAQALGLLAHPGIAQIYEAGAEHIPGPDGAPVIRPFLAMEYVRGNSLAAYISNANADVPQRLELFIRICEAVQHAHQKGVIHRDLKPGNILVDAQGHPKVLDFGIARIADAEGYAATLRTDMGQLMGTLPYMSPEQLAGESKRVDARSDVYALGVILFELLTGRLPHDVRAHSLPEAVRILSEARPIALGQVAASLRGDLETICAKALDQDPERRYGSPAELAADLKRYLRFEPISARPSSVWYELRKFTRRNRALVGGVAVAFLALALGIAGTSYGLFRARASEQRAADEARRTRIEAARSNETLRFLQEMLASADPERMAGKNLTVRDLLDEASIRMESEPPREWYVESAVHLTLGETYRAIGEYDAARRHLAASLELCEAHAEEKPDALAAARYTYGRLRLDEGQFAESDTLLHSALEFWSRDPERFWRELGTLRTTLADLKLRQGEYAAAEEQLDAARTMRAARFGRESAEYAISLASLSRLRRVAGAFDDAASLAQEALGIMRHRYPKPHPRVADALSSFAGIRAAQGQFYEAASLFAEALEIRRQVYGPNHIGVAGELNNLATQQWRVGKAGESLANLGEAIEIYQRALPQNRRDIAMLMQNRATLLLRARRIEEAESTYREALDTMRSEFPGDHGDTATILNALGGVLRMLERYNEAEQAYGEAMEMRRRLFTDRHPLVATTLNNIAWLHYYRQKHADAERLFRDALGLRREVLPQAHPDVAHSLQGLTEVLLIQQRPLEAEPFIRECLEIRETRLGPAAWETVHARQLLGDVFQAQGRVESAEREYEVVLAAVAASADDLPASRVGRVMERIATFFELTDRNDRASEIRSRIPPPEESPE